MQYKNILRVLFVSFKFATIETSHGLDDGSNNQLSFSLCSKIIEFELSERQKIEDHCNDQVKSITREMALSEDNVISEGALRIASNLSWKKSNENTTLQDANETLRDKLDELKERLNKDQKEKDAALEAILISCVDLKLSNSSQLLYDFSKLFERNYRAIQNRDAQNFGINQRNPNSISEAGGGANAGKK